MIPRFKADLYHIKREGDKYLACIFQGTTEIAVIEAKSEKQAHFLAKQEYPEAKSPAEQYQEFMKDANSAEGKRYRAEMREASRRQGKSGT